MVLPSATHQLLALGAILSCVRILAALEIHQFLGPLQFSIRQLLQDLFRFLVLLLVIVFAFAAGLTKIYEATPDTADNHDALIAFGSLERSLRTTFWALFGLVDFEKLAVTGYRATSIQVLGEVVFGVYLVLVVILLLNLLIALLNRSYELIAGNSDLVWKFARARLIREFDMYPCECLVVCEQAVIFFLTLPLLFFFWNFCSGPGAAQSGDRAPASCAGARRL